MTYLYWLALLPLPLVVFLDYRKKDSFTAYFINELLVPSVLPLAMSLVFMWGLSNLISQ